MSSDPRIRALSDVDYALDVHVPAADLQPQVLDALKKERAGMTMKGFRPGKVPMGVVRKLVGPQTALQVAEQAIGEAYRQAVAEPGALDVIGQPRLESLDFDPADPEADLTAVVLFGIRPAIALADLDGVPVTRLVRAFTDEDVDADLERRREMAATEEEAPDGTAVAADHVAVVTIQPVDADGEPTGPPQHDARLVMANPGLRQEMKDALLGTAVGDEVVIELPHQPEVGASQHDEDDEHASDHDEPEAGASQHIDRYRVTVTSVQTRVLPEPDAAFVTEQTKGRTDSLDELRDEIRTGLDESWQRRARQAMEQKMVEEFVLAHRERVPVPTTLSDSALDAMLDEVRERNGGQLPPTYEVEAYREQNRQQAEDQVRWLLVKDALIHEEGLEVTNEDFEAEFAKMAGEDADMEMVRGYFMQQPQLMEQMGDHLINQRVFGALERRFTVVDKTREDLEREAEARKAEPASEAPGDEPEAVEAGDDADAPAKRGLFGRKKKADDA